VTCSHLRSSPLFFEWRHDLRDRCAILYEHTERSHEFAANLVERIRITAARDIVRDIEGILHAELRRYGQRTFKEDTIQCVSM
jgi:hypothetical protein